MEDSVIRKVKNGSYLQLTVTLILACPIGMYIRPFRDMHQLLFNLGSTYRPAEEATAKPLNGGLMVPGVRKASYRLRGLPWWRQRGYGFWSCAVIDCLRVETMLTMMQTQKLSSFVSSYYIRMADIWNDEDSSCSFKEDNKL